MRIMSPYRTNEPSEYAKDDGPLVVNLRNHARGIRAIGPSDRVMIRDGTKPEIDYLVKRGSGHLLLPPIYLDASLPEAHVGLRLLHLLMHETDFEDERVRLAIEGLIGVISLADQATAGLDSRVEQARAAVEIESKKVLELALRSLDGDSSGDTRRERDLVMIVLPIISYGPYLSDAQEYQLRRFRSSSLVVLMINDKFED